MNRGTVVLASTIVGVIALTVIVYELIGRRHGQSPIGEVIRTALRTERIVAPAEKPKAAAPVETPAPKPSRPPVKPAVPATQPAVSPVQSTPAALPAAPPPATTATSVPAETARPLPPGLAVGVAQRRIDTFVAGNRADWTGFDIFFDRPMTIRAGGAVRAGDVLSGPAGLGSAGTNGATSRAVRALPGAPHLALIARVCSADLCSAPFLVGARTLLCPAKIGLSGDLQFWINNYVQVDGYQTLGSFTDVAGGYRFEVEPADDESCDAEPSAAPPKGHAAALDRGDVLKHETFAVSARQNAWKPFFLPLGRPLVLRASGEMSPYERAKPTGPDGIEVPDVPSWTYPGTKTVVIDADHPLIVRKLPYQSLIGRLCSASGCGEPFLVGAERIVCPDPRYNERLELWINHIIVRSGDLQVPFADLTFQGRRGEYRFEVSSAPPGACGG